jgi:hypothetical protein
MHTHEYVQVPGREIWIGFSTLAQRQFGPWSERRRTRFHMAEASTALARAAAHVHDRWAGSSGAAVATARGHARHHASQQRRHARGQGFKSPQLHHYITAGQRPCSFRPQHAASRPDPGSAISTLVRRSSSGTTTTPPPPPSPSTASPSPNSGPRRKRLSRRCMPTRSPSTATTPANASAPSCWTGPAPERPRRTPAGCRWTCGPPTSASSTTTCAKASPTSAPSCSRTTPPGRCSNGRPSAYQHHACKRSRV